MKCRQLTAHTGLSSGYASINDILLNSPFLNPPPLSLNESVAKDMENFPRSEEFSPHSELSSGSPQKKGRRNFHSTDSCHINLDTDVERQGSNGRKISELSDELNQGAKNAGEAVKQVNDGIKVVKKQAESVSVTTRGAIAGLRAGWQAFNKPKRKSSPKQLPEVSSNNQLHGDVINNAINTSATED